MPVNNVTEMTNEQAIAELARMGIAYPSMQTYHTLKGCDVSRLYFSKTLERKT